MSVYRDEEAIERIKSNDPLVTIARISYMVLPNLDFMIGSTHLLELTITACREWTSLEPLRCNATLEILDISQCRIESLEVVNHMPLLKSLTVCDNITNLTLDFMATNTTITHLNITGNTIVNLEPLRSNTTLRSAKLNSNHVSSIDILSTNTTLEKLHLDNNRVQSLEPLRRNTTLRKLYLQQNDVRDLIPLSTNTTLTHLRLMRNAQIRSLEPLRGNTTVRSLGIDSTPVCDVSPLSGSNIESLSLCRTLVSDLSPLSSLKRLKFVMINGLVNVKSLDPLGMCPSLEIIYASSNPNVEDLNFLEGNETVTNIDASYSNIKRFPDLSMCSSLASIDLSINKIEYIDRSHLPISSRNNAFSIHIARNLLRDLEFLRGNRLVTSIGATRNKITNIDFLEMDSALRTICVNDNLIDHLPRRLSDSVVSLFILGNNISDLSPLWGNTHILTYAIQQRHRGFGLQESAISMMVHLNIMNSTNRKLTLRHLSKLNFKN